MNGVDLNKQQALHDDPKVVKQISFTGDLAQEAIIFFIIKEGR